MTVSGSRTCCAHTATGDHIVGIEALARRVGAPLVAHPSTDVSADERVEDGETFRSGDVEIRALHTPGHCRDHVAYVVGGTHCLTADVLFREPSAAPPGLRATSTS